MKSRRVTGWPLFSLLPLERLSRWKKRLLGPFGLDPAFGNPDAAAPCDWPPEAALLPNFGVAEKNTLLKLARAALTASMQQERGNAELDAVPASLKQRRACFVTLTNSGELRGCIGQVFPQGPLCESVMSNCRKAASCDPRFPPVLPGEVDAVQIEISVLTIPQQISFASADELLNKLEGREQGVLLQIGRQMATFLPQVWTQIPDKSEFLGRLSQKAGHSPTAWREKGASVSTYLVESFSDG